MNRKLKPIYLVDIKTEKKGGVAAAIVLNSPLRLLNEKEKLFKHPTAPGAEEFIYKLTSNLLNSHNLVTGTFNLCLCRVTEIEHYNRKYEVIVFDNIKETNEFLTLEKEYGVLTQDEDFIYVAKIKDKGDII